MIKIFSQRRAPARNFRIKFQPYTLLRIYTRPAVHAVHFFTRVSFYAVNNLFVYAYFLRAVSIYGISFYTILYFRSSVTDRTPTTSTVYYDSFEFSLGRFYPRYAKRILLQRISTFFFGASFVAMQTLRKLIAKRNRIRSNRPCRKASSSR